MTTHSTYATYAAPAGRVLLSLMFIMAGLQKIAGYEGTQAYMESQGVPGALLPLVIALEVLGGAAVLLGWKARIAALLLAGFTLVAGVIFHLVPSMGMEGMQAQNEMTHFLKNVSITGGLLLVFALGAGPLSVDNRGRAGALSHA